MKNKQKEKKMQIIINVIKKNTRGKIYKVVSNSDLSRFGRTMRALLLTFSVCVVVSSVSLAQSKTPNTAAVTAQQNNALSAFNKLGYGFLKTTLLRSAEKMPEENYNFKPTEAVRTYGQIIGHLADSQYTFCSVVIGEKNPALTLRIEETKTTKTDLIAALKDAFSYCDKAYDNLTDSSAAETVMFSGFNVPKLMMLVGNKQHSSLHYGNLVTYMRMKNIVPPTSEPGFLPQMKKK
jgi:uncharacterized damage-inducible protein DinB